MDGTPIAAEALPTVAGLAQAIRERRVSVREVVRRHLERIVASAELNAVVTLAPDAEARARAADLALEQGKTPGPLHGVPFTVKDTIDTAGVRTTAGSKTLAERVPERTATAVQRLINAGAILLGKTNCSEFAVDTHTANPLFGTTQNPISRLRTPGGSSGGEAAAVAAGLSCFGVGTDFGGSVRFPAHCTGIFSLRPTAGLVPGTGILPYFPDNRAGIPNSALLLHRLMTIGPMARRAGDLGLLLAIMAGPDGADGGVAPVPLGHPATVDPAQLAVSWCDGEGSVPVAAEVREAVRAAAHALLPIVGRVAEARPDGLPEATALFTASRDAEGMPEVLALIAGKEDTLGTFMRDYLARTPAPAPFARICELAGERDALRARIAKHFAEYAILLLPVASVTAPEPDRAMVDVDGVSVPRGSIGACCRAISLLGSPAAVVPFGRDAQGLPIGVQVVGRAFHDHEVVRVAELLQEAAPSASPRKG